MSAPLSSTQFGPGTQLPLYLTPDEVSNLDSNDFHGSKVSENRANMAKDDTHASDWRHKSVGGSANYLDALKDSVETNEGISEPVHVGLARPRDPWSGYGPYNERLLDGHHRAVVAMETNRLLPVNFWG